jgi:HPt (histidine-containing phosphotransfer) domain-containing protein
MAVRNLSLSSEELNAANMTLERLNIAVKAMLESQGEGLFYFDKDGVCAGVYSKICQEFLESEPADRHIADVLKADGEQAQNLRSLIRLLFCARDNVMGFDDLIALAPSRYAHSRGLKIHLRYRPMRDGRGNLTGILVIATDRTNEEESLRAIAAREAEAGRILRIARNRNGFLRFLTDFRETFKDVEKRPVADVMRAVHTLKGQASFFWLKNMAETLNELEQSVQAMGAVSPQGIRDICGFYEPRLHGFLAEAVKIARDIWGGQFEADGQMRVIEMDRIRAFTDRIGERLGVRDDQAEDLAEACLREIAGLPVSKALRPFEAQLRDFADMAGKKIGPVRFEGQDILILPEAYTSVIDSLVHVASNIAEHGIESAGIREHAGKPAEGVVTVHVAHDDKNQSFTLDIQDDGAGIDVAALRGRLGEAAGDLSDDALLQHVFGMNVTTRREASLASGRGVGLSAVRAEVERLGGRVAVTSAAGKGARIGITLPLIWSLGGRARAGAKGAGTRLT